MKIKPGAHTAGFEFPIVFAAGVVQAVFSGYGQDVILTSGTDSHLNRPTSLHNKGLAADFRTRHIVPATLTLIVDELTKLLDPLGFDVILETTPPHLHVEYQPKAGESWIREDA